MHALSGISPPFRQPGCDRAAGILDLIDLANRCAFEAREIAYNGFESDAVVSECADTWAATVAPLKQAERHYRALVRERVIARGRDTSRAIRADLDGALFDARAKYDRDGLTARQRINLAALIESLEADCELREARRG